ncbi:MAG: phosphoglycerate dehydrogenase [Candidatus Marinimicrobia bacterium]|nr:phosphoglycerate dehydrogenase [Candidatus Neomarinimicrobiota bacterium]
MKILLLENIHPVAEEYFKKKNYELETVNDSLDENELIEKLQDVHILGIRSKTQITAEVIKNNPSLEAIGAFCIGTNQIDMEACNKYGVAVFNAPFSNTRSVVELAIGNMIALMRQIFDKSRMLHEGQWYKTATNSFEVRGKSLGIIGYGNIGSQLSVLAEALGMKVYFYDIEDKLPLGNAEVCESMEELLQLADVITVHVDGRPSNKNLIDSEQFQLMKDGAIFINLARGFIVNIEALAENLRSGKIGGAAVDVYPTEPKLKKTEYHTVLQNLPNTILTPHIGGSTEEAQKKIAEFVPTKLHEFIRTGSTMSSVNFPNLQLQGIRDGHRIIHVHENVPGIMAQINNIFAEKGINIDSQLLKTNEKLGYVITDVTQNYNGDVLDRLKNIENTIMVRVLY